MNRIEVQQLPLLFTSLIFYSYHMVRKLGGNYICGKLVSTSEIVKFNGFLIWRMTLNKNITHIIIDRILFGSLLLIQLTSKFNSPPNFWAIQYFILSHMFPSTVSPILPPPHSVHIYPLPPSFSLFYPSHLPSFPPSLPPSLFTRAASTATNQVCPL